MQNQTLYLPGFHLPALRRRPRSGAQILAEKLDCLRQKSFFELGECFRQLIPTHYLRRTDWEALSATLLLRQIKVTMAQPGFRVTTLLDAEIYPASDIADLYFQRWGVELFFRDIKTTMGMDILRCKTPQMVRKEIRMHFIA